MLHRHKWEVLNHIYHPPAKQFEGSVTHDLARKIIEGWTDITAKCTVCGKIDIWQHFGEYSG